MQIINLAQEPTQWLHYLKAAPGGGSQFDKLPIMLGRAEGLPKGVDALLCIGDLQGRAVAPFGGGEALLLGEALASFMVELGDIGVWPTADRIGVLIMGDLYSAPLSNRRGATGDVRAVWRAFARSFAWVVGVAGNHDTFGSEDQRLKLFDDPRLNLLDGDLINRGGVKIGGVSYISATRRLHKGGRRSLEEQLELISAVVAEAPDVLLLHEGPKGEGSHRVVSSEISTFTAEVPLVICGHSPANQALWLNGLGQVLNVHERAILLQPT